MAGKISKRSFCCYCWRCYRRCYNSSYWWCWKNSNSAIQKGRNRNCGGAIGNAAEQSINIATGEQSDYHLSETVVSSTIGAFSKKVEDVASGFISETAQKAVTDLSSESSQNVIKNSITKTFKQNGQVIGHSTKTKINTMVRENIEFGINAIESTSNFIDESFGFGLNIGASAANDAINNTVNKSIDNK